MVSLASKGELVMREEEDQSQRLVLIVEDEDPIALALAFIVEDSGYIARIAGHGKQALEIMQTDHPALIITDLMMPQMNGADLIAAIQADARRSGQTAPPIVLMSAAGKQFMAQAQADAMLPKPFDLSDVEAILTRFLAPSRRD